MQTEITKPSALLNADGGLVQVGWARQPLLECNLENARFYAISAVQRFRIKRWDYYGVFTPRRFFSATIADLGYAGNIFVYTMDFENGELHEEGLVIPFSKGLDLPRNNTEGDSRFENEKASLTFSVRPDQRHVSVSWPGFNKGNGLEAEIALSYSADYESMNIVIPIGKKRFYYNRKINCLPASGWVKSGDITEVLNPKNCMGSLDWGRGAWEYQSYWNWASTSGYLPDGRTVGLNLGCGFGDLSNASENAIIVENRILKLGEVNFDYVSGEYMRPWKFRDSEGRLELVFTPFKDRTAKTNLEIIFSEVHQMFGRYNGKIVTDSGETIEIKDLIGFAEEHHARW
jgi:hypothetical protein